MSPLLKLLIGLVAVLALGWVHHSLLGNGEKLVGALERQAKQMEQQLLQAVSEQHHCKRTFHRFQV